MQIALKCLRTWLAALSAVCAVGAFVWALGDACAQQTTFSVAPFSEPRKAAIDIKLDQSKSYFEMALLVLGAVVGLVAAKEGARVRLRKDRPEAVMVVTAASVLALSLIWHQLYTREVADAYSKAVDTRALAGKPRPTDEATQEKAQTTPKQLEPAGVPFKMPDIFGSAIDHLLSFQIGFFAAGVFLTIVAIVSAYHLKGE